MGSTSLLKSSTKEKATLKLTLISQEDNLNTYIWFTEDLTDLFTLRSWLYDQLLSLVRFFYKSKDKRSFYAISGSQHIPWKRLFDFVVLIMAGSKFRDFGPNLN